MFACQPINQRKQNRNMQTGNRHNMADSRNTELAASQIAHVGSVAEQQRLCKSCRLPRDKPIDGCKAFFPEDSWKIPKIRLPLLDTDFFFLIAKQQDATGAMIGRRFGSACIRKAQHGSGVHKISRAQLVHTIEIQPYLISLSIQRYRTVHGTSPLCVP